MAQISRPNKETKYRKRNRLFLYIVVYTRAGLASVASLGYGHRLLKASVHQFLGCQPNSNLLNANE